MEGQIIFRISFLYAIFTALVTYSLPGSILQDRFGRSNILPTSSCIEVAKKTKNSLHCTAACLRNHKNNVICSRHVVSTRCVCCGRVMTGTTYSDTKWTTYKQGSALIVYSYCPVGYIEVHSSAVKTCLRLELITKDYNDAAISCQADGGDLIRIDSAEKYTIFLQFIADHVSSSAVGIWIQSFRDPNMNWKFHDGTAMPGHCPFVTTNYPGQIRIRFDIAENRCYDKEPTYFYLSICEI